MESFDTKYRGYPVTAFIDSNYKIVKVLLKNSPYRVTGIDYDLFASDNEWLISQVKIEIDQEIKEYSNHETR